MPEYFDEIPDDPQLLDWIRDQQIFHVASAPLKGSHINVSPKGHRSFKLVNRRACWYLDLTGSGNETISHLYEAGNGRLVILFEAFEGPPRILRLWGKGRAIERGTPEFDRLMNEGDSELGFSTPQMMPGARSIIWLDIARVGTSCGYTVPYMKFEGHRNNLIEYMARHERNDDSSEDPFTLPWSKGLKSFWTTWNTWSMDGLPGVKMVADKVSDASTDAALKECGLTKDDIQPRRSDLVPLSSLPLLTGVGIGFLLASLTPQLLRLCY